METGNIFLDGLEGGNFRILFCPLLTLMGMVGRNGCNWFSPLGWNPFVFSPLPPGETSHFPSAAFSDKPIIVEWDLRGRGRVLDHARLARVIDGAREVLRVLTHYNFSLHLSLSATARGVTPTTNSGELHADLQPAAAGGQFAAVVTAVTASAGDPYPPLICRTMYLSL